MKVISYTALHYGAAYLGYALRSVIDAVDEAWILYSAIGSHGHRTTQVCPETRDELYQIAKDAAGNKLRWRNGEWAYEGQQRESIHQYAPDVDAILVIDADEIWTTSAVDVALFAAQYQQARRYRLPMVHYWRSFQRCVLHDPAYPERVILPKVHGGAETLSAAQLKVDLQTPILIHHFGYAQRPEIVEYKQLTHGHRGEWRKDVDWFRDRFMANVQVDCHPVGSEWWQPEKVDPFALGLPEWMREHEYANMEVIGESLSSDQWGI